MKIYPVCRLMQADRQTPKKEYEQEAMQETIRKYYGS